MTVEWKPDARGCVIGYFTRGEACGKPVLEKTSFCADHTREHQEFQRGFWAEFFAKGGWSAFAHRERKRDNAARDARKAGHA